MAKTLNEWAKDIHQNAVAHGWWDEPRSFGDIVALCHRCQRHGAGHAAPHGQDHAVPEGTEVLRELPNAAVKTHAERTQEHTCVRFSFSAKLQLSDTLFVVP